MRIRTVTTLISVALLSLTACSGSTPDVAACKAAMHKQYEAATATGEQGKRPAVCRGVDDKTLQRLAGEVITEQLNGKQLEQDLDRLEQEMNQELGTPSP